MHFGVDYYPEHWSEDRWEKDAKMMEDAGFNTVRVAEFAWSKMERTEGNFDFTWLNEAIETLAEHGLDVVLGTPTAAPPSWLTDKHPEILAVNEEKEVMRPGHRRHYCVNSDIYREYTKAIVGKMAEKFGEDNRVIGWQTDNELGHPVCYCDDCREEFHNWLREKYESLDELNRRWGTVFWSHEYTEWNQIPLPHDNPRKGPNPSLHLDYKRFFSHSTVEYNQFQVDILRDETENQWISHNFMPHFPNFDHFDMAEDLDLATWDHYPTEIRETYSEVSAGHDLTYGFKDKPFWVMEQQCSYLTRDDLTPAPRPGETRMWTYQSIAHGADGIVYFRWRPCRFGDEQFHGGVLRYNGSRNSPRYQEIKEIGKELERVEDEIAGTAVEASVGIYYSFEQNWSMDTYRYHSPIDYKEEIMKYYDALFEASVNVKFVSRKSDLDQLDLLLVPVMPMVDEGLENKLESYVQDGGTLVGTFRTGIKNFDNVVTKKTFPGRLAELFGIEISEFTPVADKPEVSLKFPAEGGRNYEVQNWADCIEPVEAKTVAEYSDGWPGEKDYSGITRNEYGNGTAYYVGFSAEEEFYEELIPDLLEEADVMSEVTGGENVEVRRRSSKDSRKELTFVINHASTPGTVELPDWYEDIITGKEEKGQIELEPFGVMVLKEKQ